MENIIKRLPGVQAVIPVYAVCASMLFGWMFIFISWNLPSWLKFLSLGHLFAVFSYSLVITLAETLLFLSLMLLACLILPASVLRNDFTVRGTMTTIVLLGLLFLRAYLQASKPWYFSNLYTFGIICIGSAIGCSYLATRLVWLQKSIAWMADRFIIFLYVLIPLSLVAFLTVLIRNLI